MGNMGYNLKGIRDPWWTEENKTAMSIVTKSSQLNRYKEKDQAALPYDLTAAHIVPLQLPSRSSN